MSKLFNHYNCEEEVLGNVPTLPEKKPLEIIEEQDNFIFKEIINLNK